MDDLLYFAVGGGVIGYNCHLLGCSSQKVVEGIVAGVAAVAMEHLLGESGFYIPVVVLAGRVVVELGTNWGFDSMEKGVNQT